MTEQQAKNDVDTQWSRPDANSLWRAVLAEINIGVSELVYKMWFLPTRVQNLTENSIEIICKSKIAIKNLEKYQSLIQESVNKVGRGKYKLILTVGKVDATPTDKANKKAHSQEASDAMGPLFETTNAQSRAESGFVPHYTFDNFVMGSNNRLAYSVAWAVATNPGKQYNPMFLYSGVGLGKTHLMQAIGNKLLKEKPNLKVVYTTSEQFTNELVESIQTGARNKKYALNQFRKKFREADVLMIDDIQFIVGRDSTQEEFFHTFNALHMAGKQIILTSDRPPKDFVNLEERITSRFGSGITVDIQKPDIETRIAILRNKRDRDKDVLSNEVIDFIASKVDTNIRELEGAYLQVVTSNRTENTEVSLNSAAKALGQIVPERKELVNPNTILNAVCKYYSINKSDIKGPSRTRNYVIPRQIAMYLLKEMTGTPLIAIGELLGGRDHTTIMHGAEKIKGEMSKVPRTEQDVHNIKQLVYAM